MTERLTQAEATTQTQTINLPVGVSGSFYFLVQTDLYGQVFQNGNTAANLGVTASAETVNLTPPPDLQVPAPTAPTTDLASHGLTFTYQVNNIGAGATVKSNPKAAWNDSFYLSPTQTYDAGTAILLGTLTYTGSLDAGASYQNTVTETVPNGLSGSYYLIVDADSGDSVYELDQTGKFGVGASAIQITSKPADLAVTATRPGFGRRGRRSAGQLDRRQPGHGRHGCDHLVRLRLCRSQSHARQQWDLPGCVSARRLAQPRRFLYAVTTCEPAH